MTHFSRLSKYALSLPEATEEPHFEKRSYRVKKKIFATVSADEGFFVVKLTELQQSVFCKWDESACHPVPNKWGLQGWTRVYFEKVDEDFLKDIVKTSYSNVAPKKLVEMIG
ncbi:MmcQ/YjbR family DNA-binding protein [uncultured Fluviicola sp.]|uniref:MmcQ/YjbR family DNA-binding protein n=1 Tax=uncultured Fluviicola sp. TaxID=463303 RepID=UPI0025D6C9A3|nr:MmcQ/YjbR family DNA-binding protein [uncultured Fluviicola sp.]